MKQDNFFSIVTPKGEGGIGVIELFGKDALKIIGKIFKPFRIKNKIKPNRIYLGNIYDDNQLIDEVIIHFVPADKSLTKLDTIEINAHGGIMSCRMISNLLKKLGVKEIFQDEVINLAYKRGVLDIIQKEALENLLKARTPLAAGILVDQYRGVLSLALKSRRNLSKLLKSSLYGLSITHPKRILILGEPNVGKSTLFNAIVGKERAITHHLAGTTRDTIEESISINGFPFILVDTAGLRKIKPESNNTVIEKMGIFYAKREISKADLILIVIDTNEIKLSESLLKRVTDIPVIIVRNKIDLFNKSKIQNPKSEINEYISVSALKRIGIDKLRQELLKTCGLDKFRYKSGEPIIFTARQQSLLKNRVYQKRQKVLKQSIKMIKN
jgi:tRNA modification GTPase